MQCLKPSFSFRGSQRFVLWNISSEKEPQKFELNHDKKTVIFFDVEIPRKTFCECEINKASQQFVKPIAARKIKLI